MILASALVLLTSVPTLIAMIAGSVTLGGGEGPRPPAIAIPSDMPVFVDAVPTAVSDNKHGTADESPRPVPPADGRASVPAPGSGNAANRSGTGSGAAAPVPPPAPPRASPTATPGVSGASGPAVLDTSPSPSPSPSESVCPTGEPWPSPQSPEPSVTPQRIDDGAWRGWDQNLIGRPGSASTVRAR